MHRLVRVGGLKNSSSFFVSCVDFWLGAVSILYAMTHPEPQENENYNPEAEEIARLYESSPDLSGSEGEAEGILADLARYENDEAEEAEDSDGQPDWAQEWHDFDPDC